MAQGSCSTGVGGALPLDESIMVTNSYITGIVILCFGFIIFSSTEYFVGKMRKKNDEITPKSKI